MRSKRRRKRVSKKWCVNDYILLDCQQNKVVAMVRVGIGENGGDVPPERKEKQK